MNSLMDIHVYRLRLQCTAKYGADKKGEFTFLIQAGKSVIDYAIAAVYSETKKKRKEFPRVNGLV
jgi:hypothetical protein